MSRSGNIEGVFLLVQGNKNIFYKPQTKVGFLWPWVVPEEVSDLLSQIWTGMSNFNNVFFRQEYLNSNNFNQGYSKQCF